MWNPLEQPWTLLITAAVLVLVVWIVRMFITGKKGQLLWLIPIIVAALAFSLDFFIATDREKIVDVIDTAVDAFENEQPVVIAGTLAADYRDSHHRDKQAIVTRMNNFVEPPLVNKVYDSISDLEIKDTTAKLTLLNRIFIDERSEIADFINVVIAKVRIELTKNSSGDWLINRIEVETINNQPANWGNVKNSNY